MSRKSRELHDKMTPAHQKKAREMANAMLAEMPAADAVRPAQVVPFPVRTKRPDPECPDCSGKGWQHTMYTPHGTAHPNGRVVICACMKGPSTRP